MLRCVITLFAPLLCAATLRPGRLPKSFVEVLPNPPPWQAHSYNNNTYILRQSGFTNYEKPFLYLLFGDSRAFLLDTGSLHGHPVQIIESVMAEYMTSNPSPLELIIGHSHSHWDHTAGDAEMRNFSMPNVTTTFIEPDVASVIDGYSIPSWPNETAILDLGGSRLLDIIPLPGHTPDAIAVYDRQTGLLLTGDSVYPGRVYVPQSKIRTFKESHSRLRRFLKENDWEVSWVLGCHIEQKSTPFEEYPLGTRYQPHEHVLQFNVSILDDVEDGLNQIDDNMGPEKIMFAEFSLVVPRAEGESMSKWAGRRQNPLRIGDSF